MDYWALGIMLVQMLFGEQLDFLPLVISSFTENPNADTSIVEQLDLPTHVSTAAKECIRGLLEIDPEKRLGSPNSPHGQIRNHRFFKEGCRIEWQDMEDGIIKSPYKNPLVRNFCFMTNETIIHGNKYRNVLVRRSIGKIGGFTVGKFSVRSRSTRSRWMACSWTFNCNSRRRGTFEILRSCQCFRMA